MELKKKNKVEIEVYDYKDDFELEIFIYDKYYDVYLSKDNMRQLVFTTSREGISIEVLMTIVEQVLPSIVLEFPFCQDPESLFAEAMDKIVVVDG